MKEVVKNDKYGEIVYEESFWTGKKSLSINGLALEPINKKEYMFGDKKATLKGNYITGVSVNIEDDTINITKKTAWYEIILGVLPLLFVLIWGNNRYLITLFPIVGGAIGGAVAGICGFLSLFFMKKVKLARFKILIGIGFFALTILINFIIAYLILHI